MIEKKSNNIVSLNNSIKTMSNYSQGLEKEILDEIINEDESLQFEDEKLKKLVHIQLNQNNDKR